MLSAQFSDASPPSVACSANKNFKSRSVFNWDNYRPSITFLISAVHNLIRVNNVHKYESEFLIQWFCFPDEVFS